MINYFLFSNGCKKPDYKRDILADLPSNLRELIRKTMTPSNSTTDEVKQCIVKTVKGGIKDEINECLTEQNVTTIKEVPETLLKELISIFTMDSGNDTMNKLL